MSNEANSRVVEIIKLPGETQEMAIARSQIDPALGNALTIYEHTKIFGERDVSLIIDALHNQVADVRGGSLKRAEAMLTVQAHALDALFGNLARISSSNMSNLNVSTQYMKLAMRAQNQCRMTLETLSNIKNPPVVYAKQANIANGPQQVNNGMIPVEEVVTPAQETRNPQNELMGLETKQ